MSDMIERLSALSREAGTNASESLNARATLDSIQERIDRGVRRRRQLLAGTAAVTVLIAGAGAAVVPLIFGNVEAPAVPGNQVEIVDTTGALTVLSDGSMSLVTSRGTIVDIPPVAPADYQPFAPVGRAEMCEGPDLTDFPLGWEYHQESARELLTFGRPQFLLDTGPRLLAQGSTHYASSWADRPALGLQLETDTAVAPHVVMRSAVWLVGETGAVSYGTRLDAVPPVTIEGGANAGKPVALIQAGPVREIDYCYPAAADTIDEWYYPRYLQVDVFITDHSGNTVLIATHRSWSALDFSQIPEAQR